MELIGRKASRSATSADLEHLGRVAVDGSGNIYIADSYQTVIRKVGTNGIIGTISMDGNGTYSGDSFISRIRKIDSNGNVSTIAEKVFK